MNDFDQPLPGVENGSFDAPLPESAAPEPATAQAVPQGPMGPQTMVAPDGKHYVVQPNSIKLALDHGWKTPETIEAERAHDIEQNITLRHSEKEQHRVAGGVRRFMNEALFGAPELIDQYQNPEEHRIESAAEERFAKEHPAEVFGEKAAGFAASLAIPGVGFAGKLAERAVLEGAEQTLVRKLTAAGAKMAAEGAAYSAPQAAVAAAYGDPERAAETMAWGTGLGLALGVGGKAIGMGTKAVAEGVSTKLADVLSHRQANGVTVLDDVARNLLGITDKQAQRLGPERLARIVERADEEGLLRADPHKRAELIAAMLKDSGTKLGDHLEALDGLLEHKKFADMGPRAADVAADFRSATIDKFPELSTDIHLANRNYAQKLENTILGSSKEPSFEALQNVRKAIRSEGKAYVSKSVQAKLAKLADDTVQRHLEDAAQHVYESSGLKERYPDYLAQKERYEAGKALTAGLNEFKGTGRLPHGLGGPGISDLIRFGVHGNPITGALHVAGHHALKAFTSNKWGLLGKSVSFLRKAAEDSATAPIIGGLMAKEGSEALTAHIDALPSILSGAKKVAGHTAADAGKDYVEDVIGPTTGLSKQQQYEKLTGAIARATVDSNTTADHVGRVASAFTGTNVQLASLVAEKHLNKIAYLQAQIPKDPSPPRPFQHTEWKPSPQQQRDYLAKVEIASNPMVVWKHYEEGKLTKVDRDVLMAVYPVIYRDMVAQITATAFDPRAPELTRAQRMQLSTFTGMPMDGSMKNLTAIQQALQTQGGGQDQGGGPKPSSRPKLKSPGVQTDTQRRTAGVATH
jgi:hypothetical protein